VAAQNIVPLPGSSGIDIVTIARMQYPERTTGTFCWWCYINKWGQPMIWTTSEVQLPQKTHTQLCSKSENTL